jgi:uncharacterized protein (TIGR04255 family)
MAEPRNLARPPITEALVDLRILGDPAIDASRLQPLRETLADTFPKVEEKRLFRSEFRVEEGKILPPESTDMGFQGLWFASDDGSRIAQFRTDGFTFNNVGLGRYIGGSDLIDESLRLWSLYAGITRPSAVVRLALRYLNRLDLPLGDGDEFSQFLTAPPELPVPAPQRVSSFVSRVVAQDDSGASAIVTQKLDTPASPVPLIVDVDVFFSLELEPRPDHLRRFLGMLRALKNRCFFALLTEEAVKLYL